MKKMLFALFLVGCGSSYEVRSKSWNVCEGGKELSTTRYMCVHQRPIFYMDADIAFCTTLEECNKICASERAK